MKLDLRAVLAAAAVFLGGCAGTPQQPVQLSHGSLGEQTGRIGVAMAELPKVDTHIVGADCLLCLAVASAANSDLTTHANTLPYEDLPKLKDDMAALLRKKGVDVVVIPEPLKLDALADFSGQAPNAAKKDFTPLQKKYGVDKLAVIHITNLGFWRTYSAYVPTSAPKGVLKGTGYIVNLKTNAYEWYEPVDIQRSSDGNWDEPPKFPGLTNAYFQAIEYGKDSFLKPFGN
jgi:hypothetical protein